MKHILLTRDNFRESVFKRDGYRCIRCGCAAMYDQKGEVTNLDSHHLIERRLWDDGGYFTSNGVSVCEPCHRLAEQTVVTCDELRELAGITEVLLPEHLYADNDFAGYTKWGDIILKNGNRVPGELFQDESVQKILKEGDVLDLYISYIKYPRTYHCTFSEKLGKDDRRLSSMESFEGKEVVVMEKRDGENTSCYWNGYIHARSLNSENDPTRKPVWGEILAPVLYQLNENWRICGENLYARHTVPYDDLNSFFEVFSIWDERNYCISWEETEFYAAYLGLTTVPVLYKGIYDEHLIRGLHQKGREGYVIRLAGEFPYSAFRKSVAKFVAGDFVIPHGLHW